MLETTREADEAQAARPGAADRLRQMASAAVRHRGAAAAFGVRIGAAGLAYLLQIVLARGLGAEQYGVFSFAWSLVAIGGFLAPLGFAQTAVRFLAQYEAAGQHGLAQGFLRAGIGATMLGSLIAGIATLVLFPLVEAGYGALCCTVLAIGIVALPFFALTDFMEGVARSQGWTIRALAPPYILRQGVLVLALLGALLLGRRVSAEGAMIAALAATLLAASVQLAWIAPALRRALPAAPACYDLPAWRRAAFPTLLADCALLARQNIDLIIVGLLAGPVAAGLYFAASRIASLLGLIDFAVGAAFGHRFARAAEQGAGAPAEGHPGAAAKLEAIHAEARRLTFAPGLLAALMLAIAAPLILALFGADFSAAILPTEILLAGAAIRLTLGPAEDLLAMAGHPEQVWRANAAGAAITALGAFALVPALAATGAAIAASAGTLVAVAVLARGVRRHLGFNPFLARRGAA